MDPIGIGLVIGGVIVVILICWGCQRCKTSGPTASGGGGWA